MIIAIWELFVICDGQNENEKCHVEAEQDYKPDDDQTTSDDYFDWLGEIGWLTSGDSAYCPACRHELHDPE